LDEMSDDNAPDETDETAEKPSEPAEKAPKTAKADEDEARASDADASDDELDESKDDGDEEEPAKAEKAEKKTAKAEKAEKKTAKAEKAGKKDTKKDSDEKDGDEGEKEPPVVTKGNPLRRVRGGVTLGVGGFLTFLLMAHNGQLRLGVPLGALCVLVCAWGVMDLLGTFDDADEHVAGKTTLGALWTPIGYVLGSSLLLCGSLMGAQSGWGRQWAWGIAVTVAFIGFVAAIYTLGVALGPWAKDEDGKARPLHARHGFWLLVAASALYLPALGAYSLWDPWETHYGEVAREILARDDWVSLWWAQDGWFWSKPILNFWIQSLSMATLGTHYRPDQMLQGYGGPLAHPEWVVRFPNFLLTVAGMYLLYKGVARVFGRRAGLIGGLVLATMPDWFFLAHQTMTDMPIVAPMCATMGLVILGLFTDPERRVKVWEVEAGQTKWRLSAWHLVFMAILMVAIPQILYLLSRNVELVLHGDGPFGFRPHWDEFRSGSGGGNCGLPGNEACNVTQPAAIPRAAGVHPASFGLAMLRLFGGFEPVIQALLWAGLLGSLLYLNWGERRTQRLYYLGAWFFAAIATMGKGPVGFGLPVLCTFAYIATKRRWSDILRFEAVGGLLVILTVAIPWYVAMYVRHGSPFTDRLIFHDMFNRAFSHVHDTNEGDDTSFRFYIWQLGYALFPWTGLAPLGLLWWARRGDTSDASKGDASIFLVMWFVFAYGIFSFMGTKFHHYIFPAVPPTAMLIGVVLDEALGDGPILERTPAWPYLVALGGGVALLVALVTGYAGGSVLGDEKAWSTMDKWVLGGAGALLVLGVGAFFVRRGKGPSETFARTATIAEKEVIAQQGGDPYRGGTVVVRTDAEGERRTAHEGLMIGAAAVAGVLVLAIVGRDLALKPENADQPGAIRLLHLFTYNYRRPWPESLDFKAVLIAFAAVACVVGLLLAVVRIRKHAVMAFGALAFVWAVWGLDVYMVKTAPHWGQHEVIQAYYADRKGPEEPLVAYQMNWKGENFYTGNKVPAFVSSGANFTTWVKQQKDKGTHAIYFVTEHSRTGGLRGEVGAKTYKEITDKNLCNKFVLVRAEL
jgi:4-amino-4-deoxy-L-arabinose transferase-like glycosyltransferase